MPRKKRPRKAKLTREQRFRNKLRLASNGCLIWVGAIGAAGYGNFWDGTEFTLAHRYAWELEHGPIVPRGRRGAVILQTCDNKLCCLLAHLQKGTHADNHADCIAKGRGPQYKHVLSIEQESGAYRRWQAGETQQHIAHDLSMQLNKVIRQDLISLVVRRFDGRYIRSSR